MEISQDQRNLLDSIYYNEKGGQGAFSTVKPLYREAHKKDSAITYKKVREYLKSVGPYLIHKRILRRFPRRSMLVLYPGHIWAADLVFYINDKSPNNQQKKYLLNVQDVFTKYNYSRPLLNKTAAETLKGFVSILEESKKIPKFLFVDQGLYIDHMMNSTQLESTRVDSSQLNSSQLNSS